MTRVLLVGGLILSVSNVATGQSLADVAKRGEEQRGAAAKKTDEKGDASKPPSKVYTNKDLPGGLATLKVDPATTASTTPAATSSEATAPSSEISEEARAAEYRKVARKDEAYWKARMQALQSALDTDQVYLAAMETRVASLNADFSRADSIPERAERAVIGRERERSLTELARLKAAVLADKKAITTAEEEARRANVPPGWLRP